MKLTLTKQISYLFVLITFFSVWKWVTIIPFNQYVVSAVQLLVIFLIILNRRRLFVKENAFKLLNLYLLWTLVCVIRGFVISENYLEYKQLLIGFVGCVVPIVVWFFVSPQRTSVSLNIWFRWSLLLMLLLVWFVGFSQYYLSPYLLLFCFIPLFKKKEIRLLVFAFAMVYIFYDTLNRSHIIKASIALLIAAYIKWGKLNTKLIRIGHTLGYLSTIALFAFVLTDATGLVTGKLDYQEASKNNSIREERSKDTRSLILFDVVRSSIEHDYWLWGHTPARGYEITIGSDLFMDQYDDDRVFNKNERHRNEMVLTNIFTWEGLIGLILYTLVYMRCSFLAVYRSKNRFIPLLGCYIAFRWSFGWVEDVNCFYIMDISLWMMIAMCYSKQFREMDDRAFVEWFNSLIGKRKAYENSGLINRT